MKVSEKMMKDLRDESLSLSTASSSVWEGRSEPRVSEKEKGRRKNEFSGHGAGQLAVVVVGGRRRWMLGFGERGGFEDP
ncbi:hypothetical protein L1987_60455 [Smallanthus sonchifolius]|uniref:Uncharacterized protein n=1 Tax=Smallanthus sonchifolius TaxID=185202 RepID=A0ACB9D8H6_9ASTR|nr:hypothetical protein L1987_60455 [Smallanthus sonchifolius]